MISVPKLIHIWHYQAPKSKYHQPRIIDEGNQDIEIVTGGRGFFEYKDRILEITPGTVLWHKPGDQTIYLSDLEDPYECIVVKFQDEQGTRMPRVSRWTNRGIFYAFIDEILTEYHSENPNRDRLACYIYGQLIWQCREWVEPAEQNKRRSAELNGVVEWIEEHFSENLQLEQLADLAGVSVPHLHPLFKSYTGKTPYQFILGRRLQEAKKLLASTPLQIKEIALRSGFRDVGNFCRVFKTNSGMTAQEYRLQHMDKR